MNFGDCPYQECKGFISVAVPEKTPAFTKITCDECGRELWYRCSRIEPQAFTLDEFAAAYEVDEEKRTIKKREPHNALS